MPRFILSFTGEGPKPPGEVARLLAEGDARLVDDSLPRMILVEGPESPLRSAVEKLGRWKIDAEHRYRLPPPHPASGPLKKPE